MTVKELKAFIKDLPDDMQLVSINGDEELDISIPQFIELQYYNTPWGRMLERSGSHAKGSGCYDPKTWRPVGRARLYLRF